MFNRFSPEEFLITNELGYYYFIDEINFQKLVEERYSEIPEEILNELKEQLFIYDSSELLFTEKAFHEYRKSKQYLFAGTCLHIFVLTNGCNMNCVYCQAQDNDHPDKGMMDFKTAEKAVEIALQSPAYSLDFEFQGGEPLLNYPVIKHIVEYTEEHKNDKTISFSIVTNTLALNEEMMEFFFKHKISISTSLDGDRELHNCNRPSRDGTGTFSQVIENIHRMQEMGISVGVIQTTTRMSLKYSCQIVDTYLKNGLTTVFIRPLTPLGYAKEHWDIIGYSPCEFLDFYKDTLLYILKMNTDTRIMREGHATIFLNKILGHNSGNYMELRSPCGAGIGQVAYYYDGRIYTCDEARMLGEMGNDAFKIGNVAKDTYQSIMESRCNKITCQASILETIPQCCDCAYHPYCGVCPVVNLATDGNIYAREVHNYRCQIYKGMLDLLFDLIQRDGEELRIFKRWICGGVRNE